LGSETSGSWSVHVLGGLSLEGDGRMSGDKDYTVRTTQDRGESVGDSDVQLDVPALRVEEIDLEVEDLQARVSVRAELADLVNINIGLDVDLGEVKLQIKGVEAQAQLKARLDNVRAIFSEVLASLQHNPQLFRQALGPTDQTNEAPEETGEIFALRFGSDEGQPRVGSGATKAARRKAEELGVDLSDLEGTGLGGRVIVSDVMQAARGYNQGEQKE
jgi:pyruvate/2-oxoglutarate dehydrogenase complex dihydrolipoamide acyltransferase (E2) component